jgi:hypothetical protein
MRGTRWLLLLAIAAILGGTAFTYYTQRRANIAHAAPKPPEIAKGMIGTAEDWHYERADAGKSIVKMSAHAFRQLADNNQMEIEGLRMDLVQRDGKHFDLV